MDEIRVITPTSAGSGSDKEHENVYASLISPTRTNQNHYYSQLSSSNAPCGRQLPRVGSPESCSLLDHHRPARTRSSSNNYLTLTGTLKRGSRSSSSKRNEKIEECLYDVQLNLTSEHISNLEKKVHAKYHDRCFCGLQRGIHIFLFSLVCLPLFWVVATWQAFYLGTLTWYNIFIYYNEDRTCCHKLLSPFVLLAYPLWIVPITVLLGLFGGLYQISWYFDSWRTAIAALDGGFFGWFCNWLDVPDCCPYQVILLSANDYERPPTGATLLWNYSHWLYFRTLENQDNFDMLSLSTSPFCNSFWFAQFVIPFLIRLIFKMHTRISSEWPYVFPSLLDCVVFIFRWLGFLL